jgi:hypothetical protein
MYEVITSLTAEDVADRGGDFLQPVGAAGEQRDLGAGGGQQPCRRLSDAAGGPSDDGDASGQVLVAHGDSFVRG